MMSKLMILFVFLDFIFLCCGGLLLAFALISEESERAIPTTENVAPNILLTQCPLTAALINAIVVFATFLLSIPALAMPRNRLWLKLQGFLVVGCSFFTLVLGLFIWFDTLQTRKNLAEVWGNQPSNVQSLLQQRFNCCGYLNSNTPPFIVDNICPNAFTASQKMGCVGPFSNFANIYLDVIFTAAFGIVGFDVLLLLTIAMVIKHRGELERYRHIDEKNGGF